MKYLVACLLLAGCSFNSANRGYISIKERRIKCVHTLIDKDIEAKKASDICADIYKRD